MKRRKKSWIYVMLLLMGMGLLTGCSDKKESNVKVGNEVQSALPKEQEKEKSQETQQEKTQEKEDTLYVILKIEEEKQKIRLQNVETGKITEHGISDATAFRDRYGEFTGSSNMTQGKIVKIGSENAGGNLSYLQLAKEAWEQEDVQRFSIDGERKMIVVGETKYYYDDSLLVFLDGEQISLDMITEKDSLRVAGVGKKISSIFVTGGHGFLALTNTDLFEGGWLSVGNECVVKIQKELKVEVPEGTYQVSVANDGYGDTKEVTVVRGETVTLNLEEYKGEGPKKGTVQFCLKPETTVLAINGKTVDVSQPVELRYGTYQLDLSSAEYGEVSRKLVVSAKEAEITLDMAKLAGEKSSSSSGESDSGESKENSSGTNKSTTENSSTAETSSSSSTKKSTTSGTTDAAQKSDSSTASDSSKKEDSTGKSNTSDTSTQEEDSDKKTLQQLSDFISTLLD